MENTNSTPEKQKSQENNTPLRESSGVYFLSTIKLSDPNTGEVLLQIRGDE